MKCSVCQKPVTETQSSIDHIRPGRFGGLNTTTVHLACNRRKLPLWKRIMRRIGYYRWKLVMWLDSWSMCPKQAMGYTCRHRIMSNGKKECGND